MGCIGWYGPLIDLAAAPAHIGGYVQLLVFVHQFHPPQRLRASNGRELLKSMLQVGDNKQPYFDVSMWQKHVDSNISAGDIVLLQNVKVTKFRDVTMATTIQHSSLKVLFQAHELLSSLDEAIERALVGITVKKKLKIVIAWAKDTQSTFLSYLDSMRKYNNKLHNGDANQTSYKNWLCSEKKELIHCSSIGEVVLLKELSLVRFFGKIGEICLPHNTRKLDTILSVEDWIFVSKTFRGLTDKSIAKAFVCKGCKNCGCPVEVDYRSYFNKNQATLPPYCGNNVNQIHRIGWIYRPLMLHVWDRSANIPVLVKNLAAKQLFANIPAESIFESLEDSSSLNKDRKTEVTTSDINTYQDREDSHQYSRNVAYIKRDDKGISTEDLYPEDKQASKGVNQQIEGNQSSHVIDFLKIFLILLRTLLQKDENSPFEFQILVHPNASKGTGICVFELVSFKMLTEA
ncbi:uncharacterized protein LOC131078675 isoform X2 [Cryptomeria japonica]|uniref:uncharacterized protein LOC131078675 isoform X2 n=1 Tax=Cryptomeria japonica TaxID=3369 RepID=UPI0027D9D022|nr:uncharacterized protein LOC131078675 isoform X2 [Cryptomeria japonica]